MAGDTRQKMVSSAAALLRQHGVHGTSFARVLEDSSTPRGSITHHFPGGKHELILSAVTEAGTEVTATLLHLTGSGASAAQVVSAMCDYFLAGLQRTDFRAGCPVAAVANEAFDDPGLRQAAQAAIASWTGILQSRLEAEGHPQRAAAELAALSVAAIEGSLMMARVQRSGEPIEAVRAQLTNLLAQGSR